MTILVTGAGGFLGTNLLHHVATTRPEARLIGCDLRPLHPGLPGDVEEQGLNLNERAACVSLLRAVRLTHVVHAAAVTPSPGSTADISINLLGMQHVLEAALAVGTVERFLFLSSSGVYDLTERDRPCDEDHPLRLHSPYARAKREAELFGLRHAAALDVVIARIGPVYGPYEQPCASRPKVSMIGYLLDALEVGRTVTIAGTDTSRDWTFAADASAALGALLLTPHLNHRIYNVSSGVAASARTIVSALTGRGLQVCWQEDAGHADLVLDPGLNRKPMVMTRLQNETAFRPAFDIHAGLDALLTMRS